MEGRCLVEFGVVANKMKGSREVPRARPPASSEAAGAEPRYIGEEPARGGENKQ